MSLLTAAQAQALGAGIGLSDADLQVVIDREEAELVRRFGAVYTGAAIAEVAHGGGRSIYLKRQVTSVTSIVESLYLGDTAPTTLIATDYYVWGQEGRIERVPYGSTAARYWGAVCTVTYVPTDDRDLWRMVLVELIRISTEQGTGGGGGVSGMGFSVSAAAGGATTGWAAQRDAQYARLGWLSR